MIRAGLVALFLAVPLRASAQTPQEPYWLKAYSTAPFKEFRTGELLVKDLRRDLPRVLEAIEREKGSLSQPLQNFASSKSDRSQQLSFTCARRRAGFLSKRLRRLGKMDDPVVRSTGAPIPLDEVRAKIKLLSKEKADMPDALARVPATAQAAEEVLRHLLNVEAVTANIDSDIRFNLTVRQE